MPEDQLNQNGGRAITNGAEDRLFLAAILVLFLIASDAHVWAQDRADEATDWKKVGLLNMGLGSGTRNEGDVGFMYAIEFGEFAFSFRFLRKFGIGTKVFEGALDINKHSDRLLLGNVNSFVPLYLYLPLYLAPPTPMNVLRGIKAKVHKTAVSAFAGGSAWGVYNNYLHMGLSLTHAFSLFESDPVSPFMADPVAVGVRIGFFKAFDGTASSGWFMGVTLGTGAAFAVRK